MSSKTGSSSNGASRLPRKLQSAAGRVEPLAAGESNTIRVVASKRSGEEVSRESLSALYSLATRLHSPQLVFHAKTLETSKAKHVTAEQIWGQMNVLLRPVLRRLQDGVRNAERLCNSAQVTSRRKRSSRRAAAEDEDGSAEEEEGDAFSSDDEPRRAAASLRKDADGGSGGESDLDEEISALLAERERRKAQKSRKGQAAADGGDDSWRYAFGKGNDDEDWGEDADDLEREKEARGEGSDDEDDDDMADMNGGKRRARDRNARAMMDADDEEDQEGDAEEELAALKELYGEDFEGDDGIAFGGDEEDQDLEDDIRLDDPNAEYNDDEIFDEQRDGGKFWGKDDILDDEAGNFEDPTAIGYGAPQGEDGQADDDDDGEMDEELRAALQDPSLTDLEKERLMERKHVERLEQKRLYGADWTMAGETAASKRPREGLLDVEDLEFEHGMRAVPVITEAFTAKLEDRIRQRILDQNFDDVQRRATLTTADTLVTAKRDAALDSEKSKLSLMDLYEKEYLDKMKLQEEANGEAVAAEPLTEIERDELRAIQMWKRLSQHLDALSNFYYTPKPVQQELDARVRAVENQAPAIAVETVGNFATTRESALAPQDLFRGASRKLVDVGVDELRPEERRALRRSKKEEGKTAKDRAESRKKQYAKAKAATKTA